MDIDALLLDMGPPLLVAEAIECQDRELTIKDSLEFLPRRVVPLQAELASMGRGRKFIFCRDTTAQGVLRTLFAGSMAVPNAQKNVVSFRPGILLVAEVDSDGNLSSAVKLGEIETVVFWNSETQPPGDPSDVVVPQTRAPTRADVLAASRIDDQIKRMIDCYKWKANGTWPVIKDPAITGIARLLFGSRGKHNRVFVSVRVEDIA